MKDLVRKLVPLSIRRARRDFLRRRQWKSFEELPLKEIFHRIYTGGTRSASKGPTGFYSGSGSPTQALVAPYVEGVAKFLRTLPHKPVVADLGCGDFAVGSHLRPFCSKYIACDVVEPLIEENRKRFASLDVDFRALDITADALPPADVAFVRQVLQQLVERACSIDCRESCRRIPLSDRDGTPPGAELRAQPRQTSRASRAHQLRRTSERRGAHRAAVQPQTLRESVLCEVRDYLGVIRTTLYELH